MKVRCIKEFHSKIMPNRDFGKLDVEYTVTDYVQYDGFPICYYKLAELETGWVKADRFEIIDPKFLYIQASVF